MSSSVPVPEVLQRFIEKLDVPPQEPAHARLGPEPVDSEGRQGQQQVSEQQRGQLPAAAIERHSSDRVLRRGFDTRNFGVVVHRRARNLQ